MCVGDQGQSPGDFIPSSFSLPEFCAFLGCCAESSLEPLPGPSLLQPNPCMAKGILWKHQFAPQEGGEGAAGGVDALEHCEVMNDQPTAEKWKAFN